MVCFLILFLLQLALIHPGQSLPELGTDNEWATSDTDNQQLPTDKQHQTTRKRQLPQTVVDNNQQSALEFSTTDTQQPTTNNHHQQRHPKNKTNTRQEIRERKKCENLSVFIEIRKNSSRYYRFCKKSFWENHLTENKYLQSSLHWSKIWSRHQQNDNSITVFSSILRQY